MNHITHQHFYKMFCYLFSIIIIFSSCTMGNSENDTIHNFGEGFEDFGEGLALSAGNSTNSASEGVILLNDINEQINIMFANLTNDDKNFCIKLFVNYIETNFNFNDNEMDKYFFSVKANKKIILPVNLPENISFDESKILTVAVISAPEKHAYAIDLMSNSYGICLDFELSKPNNKRRLLAQTSAQKPSSFLQIPYEGLMLNEDFKAKNAQDVLYPPKKINSNIGEPIKLAYRAGNYDDTEDLIFFVLVNNQQVPINGSSFLHIENHSGFISYGTIEFLPPQKKGAYEVIAYCIRYPYQLRDKNTFFLNDSAYRFTIIVN